LLDIGAIYKELCHGSSITIIGDTAHSDLATNYQLPQDSRALLLPGQALRVYPVTQGVSMQGQPDLFSGAAGAGISVVAAGDHNLF
jgi:cytochrome c551/c552